MTKTNCPSREELFGCLVGTLSEDEADSVLEHVSSCSGCQETLQSLNEAEDTLMARVRCAGGKDQYADEPERQEMLARVRVLVGGDTGAGSTSPVGPVAEGIALRELGEYQLLEKLGEGGMGAVYKARQTNLDRLVALKVLATRRSHDPAAIARFYREMRAVGRLSHPNIVQAHDAREIDGSPVLAMEYVEGLDLAKLVSATRALRVADACELVRQTAVGLQHAHEQGLVHRDIKPSNLMLSVGQAFQPVATQSGRQARKPDLPIVKILDLGLALLGTNQPNLPEMTAAGTAMGTADYVSPEQVTDSHSVDIRSDIYSLGCTLYKLLSGRAPFVGPEFKNEVTKMMAHVDKVPPPISLLRTDLPPGLAAVVERMMAKKPEDRFATPGEVATALGPFASGCDLGRLLNDANGMLGLSAVESPRSASTGKLSGSAHVDTGAPAPLAPVLRGEGPGVRGGPGSGQRRIWIALAAAAAAIPLLFGVWVIIRDKSGKEVGKMQIPEGGSFEAVDEQGRPLKDVRDSQGKPRATPKSRPATKKTDKPVPAPAPGQATSVPPPPGSLLLSQKLVTNSAPLKDVTSWTIVPRPQVVTAPMERCAPRWLTAVSPYMWADPLGNAMSPDGRRAVFVGHDGSLLVHDIATSAVTGVLYSRYPVARVTWSKDSRLIAARGMPTSIAEKVVPGASFTSCEESIDIWEIETGRLLRRFEGKTGVGEYWFGLLVFSNDSKLLAVNRRDAERSSVDILSLQTGECMKSLTADDPALLANLIGLSWSPDDSRLLAGVHRADKPETIVYRKDTGEIERRIPDVASSPLFSSDGTRLAIGGWLGRLRIFPWPDFERFAEIRSGEYWGQPRLWTCDGKRLWADFGTRPFQLEMNDIDKPAWREMAEVFPTRGHFVLDEQGRPSFFGAEGNAFVLIDLESQGKRHLTTIAPPSGGGPITYAISEAEHVTVSPYDFATYRFAWSDDRRWFADASGDDEVQVWDAPAGKLAYRLRGEKPAQRIALAPDAKWLAAADAEGTVSLWEVASERLSKSLASVSGAKTALAFSPDGRVLATGSEDLQFFDIASGRAGRVLPIRVAGTGRLLVWSPDGRQLTVHAADGTLHVVDTERGAVLRTLPGHSTAGAFSADGRLFASRDQTEVIRVTELASGHMDSVLHFGDDDWVAVSADGHYCGSLGVEEQIAYLVETDAGREFLSPAEFAQKHGWKNDPAQVRCRGDALPRPAAAKGDALPQVKVKPGPEFSPLEWCVQMGLCTQQQVSTQPLLDGSTWMLGLSKPQRHKVVRFSPNGELLAIWSADNWIRVYDRGLSLRLMVPGGLELSFSPDSQFLAAVLSSSQGSQAAVFNVSTGKGVLRVDCHRRTASVAWSPDGRMLATGDETGCVRLWSVEAGALLDTLVSPSPADRVSWSPGGDCLNVSPDAWRGGEGLMRAVVWDSVARIPVAVFGEPVRPRDSAWSPDNMLAVSLHRGDRAGDLVLWSAESRRVLSSDGVGSAQSFAWSPDGKYLAFGPTIRSVPGMAVVRALDNPAGGVLSSVAWSPDSSLIAGASTHGDVFFWRPNVSKPVRSLGTPSIPASFSAFNAPVHWTTDGLQPVPNGVAGISPDTSWQRWNSLVKWSRTGDVAIAPRGTEIEVANTTTGQATIFKVGVTPVAMALSADGKTLVVGGGDRIQFWDVARGERTTEVTVPQRPEGLAVSPDGTLAILKTETFSFVYDPATGRTVRQLPSDVFRNTLAGWNIWGWFQGIGFSFDGSRFAALERTHVVVYDVTTWKEIQRIPHATALPATARYLLAWLADGTSLAYRYDQSEVRIVDSRSGELLRSIKDVYLDDALFNRDASLLVAPDWSGAVRVFETATGKLRHSFTTYADGQWVAMSPDGHWCGSPGMEQHLVHIVQTPEGQLLLSTEEFAKKYGWQNDPSKVALPSEPSSQQPAVTGDSSKKADPPQPAEPTQPAEPKP